MSVYDKLHYISKLCIKFKSICRVGNSNVDLFDDSIYSSLKSISSVYNRVCLCEKNSGGTKNTQHDCSYGTYKNCKFNIGKEYKCILHPEGRLRRKRDIEYLRISNSNSYKPQVRMKTNFIDHIAFVTNSFFI